MELPFVRQTHQYHIEYYMKMKRKIFVFLISIGFITQCCFAQHTSLPHQSQWTRLSKDSSTKYYYPKLLERFIQIDTSLSDEELALLYYGYTLQPQYAPYSQAFTEDTMYDSNKHQEYEKTVAIGRRYLKSNPVSLRGNLAMTLAFKRLGKVDEYQKYWTHLIQITRAILCTGTGESPDSAFLVINVHDEYTILNYLGYFSSEQSLIEGKNGRSYDRLQAVAQRDTSNNRVFYFDVTCPIESLSSEFKH